MPQFDTFSFFSQLFWVFSGFTTFYILLSFYLLPALAVILKVRKRKLALSETNSDDFTLPVANTSSLTNSINSLVNDISSKIPFAFSPNLTINYSFVIKMLNFETLRHFHLSILNKTWLTTLFFFS
jgi:hypothetical protein